MFDDFYRGLTCRPLMADGVGAFGPPVDVREDEKEVTVKAELPGMEEKDIEVNLADNGLTIKGEKKAEKEEKGKDNWYRETSYGAFHTFTPLPEGHDREKVDGRLEKRRPER